MLHIIPLSCYISCTSISGCSRTRPFQWDFIMRLLQFMICNECFFNIYSFIPPFNYTPLFNQLKTQTPFAIPSASPSQPPWISSHSPNTPPYPSPLLTPLPLLPPFPFKFPAQFPDFFRITCKNNFFWPADTAFIEGGFGGSDGG